MVNASVHVPVVFTCTKTLHTASDVMPKFAAADTRGVSGYMSSWEQQQLKTKKIYKHIQFPSECLPLTTQHHAAQWKRIKLQSSCHSCRSKFFVPADAKINVSANSSDALVDDALPRALTYSTVPVSHTSSGVYVKCRHIINVKKTIEDLATIYQWVSLW